MQVHPKLNDTPFSPYRITVAAKILGVKMDDVEELPAKDYTNLITPIANFFFKAG